MQPVQYRGYAQGTAFNPLILSDQSRKILEQNEEFLRGLQAKQKIERDFEVAKLKQLQENIESQRQQLNKNYGYDQRQRDRYNQSLQANAAREVQDLKRIAALDAKKPTTAAVVNDIADFLATTSKTASEFIGAVKKQKLQKDIADAKSLEQLGSDAAPELLSEKAYNGILYDAANNKLLAVGDEAQILKKEGYKNQAHIKFRSMDSGLRAQYLISTYKSRIQHFPKEFQAQSEYEFNGQKISRAEFSQLSAKDKRDIFAAQQNAFVDELKEHKLNEYLIEPVRELIGKSTNQYYGQQLEKDIERADGEMVLNARTRMLVERDPESIQTYTHVYASSVGYDYNKAMAEITGIISDPRLFSDAERENYLNSTLINNKGENGVVRFFHPNMTSEIYSQVQKNELRIANELDSENKIAEKENIQKWRSMTEEDLQDGTLDDITPEFLAEQKLLASANGQYELESLLNNAIPLTADYKREQSIESGLEKLQATRSLYPEHLRELGGAIKPERFRYWMPFAKENEEVLKPTPENKTASNEDIDAEMLGRGRQGADRSVETPTSVNIARRFEKKRYDINYKNARLAGKSHQEAHIIAMGQFLQVFGTDPYKGKYRVADIETAQDRLRKGLPASGFIDESLQYPDPGVVQDSAAMIQQRVDKLGIDAITTSTSPERFNNNYDRYRSTGKYEMMPDVKAVADLLDIPYHVVYDHGAKAHNSQTLPEEVKKGADEIINAFSSTPAAKFFNFPGNTDAQNRDTITGIAVGSIRNTLQKSPAALAYEGNYRYEALPKAALQYLPIITKYASQYSIPMPIALGLMMHESRFNPTAESDSKALGLMQLMKKTAEDLGVDRLNPEQNIEGGLRYFREILDGKHAYGRKPSSYKEALEMYNAGPNYKDGKYPRNNIENRNFARRVDDGQQPGVLDFADQFRLRSDEGGAY